MLDPCGRDGEVALARSNAACSRSWWPALRCNFRVDRGTYLADCEALGKDDSFMSCADRQSSFKLCENPTCDAKGCTCTS
jgi:hypothetical protein